MRRSRNFRQGGVHVNLTKNPLHFLFFVFLKSNIFQGGGWQLFPGGFNCLFPIETHITCDFPEGSGPPVPSPSGSALVYCAYEGHTIKNETFALAQLINMLD